MNEYITQSKFTVPRMEYDHSCNGILVWFRDKALYRILVDHSMILSMILCHP